MHPIHFSARRMLAISFCPVLLGILLAMPGDLFPVQQPSDPTWHVNAAPTLPSPQEAVPLSAQKADPKPVHLLLIGQDRREGESFSRSDAMILCSFDTEAETLTLTSFLRDLYVPIPGYGSNRLNAAYAFGGASLLCRTLEENFDLSIDGTLEVDFSGFARIIDQLGGVEISLRQDEAEHLGLPPQSGTQVLSGDQALAYSRIRSLDSDGDFSRTQRQRKLLNALADSCRSVSLPTLLKLSGEILPLLSTDLSAKALLSLARQVYPILDSADIQSQQIPTEGSFTHERIDGMAVLVPDLEAARTYLKNTIRGGET